MKKIFASKVTRREFLEKSLLGTGLVVTGTFLPSILRAQSSNEGVFPFYPYVADYNIGEFIPKDQGGKFVQMELIGTEDDKKIAELFINGLIEKNLGNPPDWSVFESTELEKSVWFNRFYYLPSFARLYYLDKNKEHLKPMMEILKNWIKENPVEGPSKSKYNWFDMQVAWRSIHLSWCYYLAKDGLTQEDKDIIYKLQGEHAKILMKDFGKKELNEFNHQSHGALAILYLAILFPALPEAQELLKTGIKIIDHHVENAFYEDGGNVEQMFGYYPFMTSVIRDAYLLFRENNIGNPQQSIPLLKKMYKYLSTVAQPDMTVPPINDSYEETTEFIIPTLIGIIGTDALPSVNLTDAFYDAEIAVLRSGLRSKTSWYVNLNAAKLIGSHDHAGRLAFSFWFNNKPIMVDSGCCNYDNPLLVEWYRTSEAHNTVLIDGKSDFATSQREVQWVGKRYTDNIIEHLIDEKEYKFCRMVSPETDESNSGVRWTRDVVLVLDKYLVVHDCFETDAEHTYDTVFRFAELEVKMDASKKLLINNGDNLALIPITNGTEFEVKMKKDYFGSHAKNIKTPTAMYHTNKKGTVHSTYFITKYDAEDDLKNIKVKQKVTGSDCAIKLQDSDGKKLTMKFTSGKMEKGAVFSLQKS